MTEYRLDLAGMSCGACEAIVEKIARNNGATITSMDANAGKVVLDCAGSAIGTIKQQLAQKGFPERGEGERGDYSNVLNYIRAIISVQPNVEVEARLLNYALGSAIILAILSFIAYSLFSPSLQQPAAYIPLIALAIVTSAATAFPYFHSASYHNRISCSNGMMIGMITGMMPGFMIGALLGATNGMFIGSTVGLIAGIAIGYKVGKCCGVMGAMEGIMAGLMAGIMGAMTSVMMLNDHLIEFLFILFAVCAFVLAGMSYMLHREAGATPKENPGANFAQYLALNILIWAVLVAFMLFGPRGPIIYP